MVSTLVTETLGKISWWSLLLLGSACWTTYWVIKVIYRLRYHPYAKYPGPRIAAVSELWYAYHWFTGRYPWAVEAAFKKYGDIVRVAPNELAFFRVEAQTDILMAGSNARSSPFIKTELQRIRGKHAGIAADPDPESHRPVRKMLMPAFNPRALKEQEPALHAHIDKFVNKLEDLAGEHPADMREWFDWLACDIAGEMCYSHDFGNVDNMRSSLFLTAFRRVGLWGTLHQVFWRFPLLYPIVFLLLPPRLAMVIPTIVRENNTIVRDRIARRNKLAQPDYFSLMVKDDGDAPARDFLVAQANHLIVGGFDPDTNLFTSAVHFLLANPDKLAKMTAEVRQRFASYDDITGDNVQDLPWVNAIIEESLRVHTNGAFGLPRISPGATVDGHWIPKGYRVQTSIFATSHSERYFTRPREFCPQRWLPASHVDYDASFEKDDKASFKPFSMGPRGCIGQNMGYLQGRILLAKMAWRLDWEHANAGEVDWERDVKLFAIWEKPPVLARFKRSAVATGRVGEKRVS
ncbi:cytochrome P450 [Astrocystis sublimbata]|nr:cytochrome P450 [Astrocystis sublimbata]